MDYNISDPEQVKQEIEKNENEALQALEDLREIMKTASGQRYFRRFFEKTRLNKNPMAKGPWVYVNCGVLEVAQKTKDELLQADKTLALKILFPEE